MAEQKLSDEFIEDVIDNKLELDLTGNKNDIFKNINNYLLHNGFIKLQINRKTSDIGKIIDKKQFSHAIKIIQKILKNTGTNINCDNYDGIIVKQLPDSDIVTQNKHNRNSGQTDIRPTKEQENIFPYLLPPEYYLHDSKVYNSLKNYFLFKIKVNLYESNLDYLNTGEKSLNEDNILESHTTVLRDNRDRLEISSQFLLDGEYFKKLRNLLYEHDYLILLKRKKGFDYDCFGIKEKDGDTLHDNNGDIIVKEKSLSNLHGKFYYFDTKTFITTDMFDDENFSNSDSCGTNLLLYGVPGCGKSWTIKNIYCKDVDEHHMERVVFHQDYTYSDFVGQILPEVSDDKVKYKFICGPFTSILKKAYEHENEKFYLIIEEINRGNAPAIFGDIFQLLDRLDEDKDNFHKGTSEFGITNSDIANEIYGNKDHKVRIPSNLTIIATMNTSDQNVFTLDTAFKRRWEMKMIENNFTNVTYKDDCIPDTDITWEVFCTAINELILDENKNNLSSEDKRLGTHFIKENELKSIEKFSEKILMYLWDDAFKFSRDTIFNNESIEIFSLENIIAKFKNNNDDRFIIFTERVTNKFEDVKKRINPEKTSEDHESE